MYCRTCGADVNADTQLCACGVCPRTGHNFCPACREPSYRDETACTKCEALLTSEGQSWKTIAPSNPPKAPLPMAILSGIVPYLGQLVLGQTKKAIALFFVSALLTPFGAGIAIWLVGVVDAYRIGKKLKNGRAVGEWEFF